MGDEGDARAVRRRRPHADLALGARRGGGRAGRAGPHPRRSRGRDRRACRAGGGPRGGGGRDAAERSLDARADPGAAARPRRWRAPVGVVRRHGAGRRRHLDRPRGAADAGDRLPRPVRDRDVARGGGGASPRRRHARPHARPARAADHVRLQGVGVDRRDPAPPCPHRIGATEARGRPAGGRGRDALRLGLGRPGAPAPRALAARPRGARHLVAHGPRPGRRAGRPARADHRDAGEDRQRGLQPPAPGDRRAARARDRGRGRQHHDAPEAQPRALRAPRHPCARGPRRRRARARRPRRRARTRRRRLEDRMGPPPARLRSRRSRPRARDRAHRGPAGRRAADAREPRSPAGLRPRRARHARPGSRDRPPPSARADPRRRRPRPRSRTHVPAKRWLPIPPSRLISHLRSEVLQPERALGATEELVRRVLGR